MRLLPLLTTSLLAGPVLARSTKHVRKDHFQDLPERRAVAPKGHAYRDPPCYGGTPNGTILPQNANTTKFAVNGSAIPFVNFDIGESYAGLLPISDQANSSELYFWFFPSANPSADEEILIWLNGGPGCSSLEGLLQENGPFLWQYGTYEPVRNPYTWVNLTNGESSSPIL